MCPKRPAIATPAVRDGVSELVDSMGSDTPSPPMVTLLPWQPATSGHNQPFSMWAFIRQLYVAHETALHETYVRQSYSRDSRDSPMVRRRPARDGLLPVDGLLATTCDSLPARHGLPARDLLLPCSPAPATDTCVIRTSERERIRTPASAYSEHQGVRDIEASRLSEDLQSGDRSVARKHSKTCTSVNAESTTSSAKTLSL